MCSPLLRARQTAEVFGIEPTIDERLREVNYGPFEGQRISELPQEMWHRWVTELDYVPDGAETLRRCSTGHRRARRSRRRSQRPPIVVVTHATPVKAAMAWALGVDMTIATRSWVDQASVTRIAVRGDRPVLSAFNLLPL